MIQPVRRYRVVYRYAALASIAAFLCLAVPPAVSASTRNAPPQLSLPTPPAAPWRIIQGYGCGTHDGWDFFAVDLVADKGPTLGAPVYAAAAGTVRAWVEPSGTLILDHGDGYLTQYTHLEPLGTPERGAFIARGAPIGAVGERGTPGNPHLHFMLYQEVQPERRATDRSTLPTETQRISLPLSFKEGYELPLLALDQCSQHQGAVLVAAERAQTRRDNLRRGRIAPVDGVLICPVRGGWCLG